MRAVVQRVRWARVRVDGEEVGHCGHGLLALVAAHRDDGAETPARMADKLAGLRVFSDAEGKMNLALADCLEGPGTVLAVSNFTVLGDTAKSRRPSFTAAAGYEQGKELFDAFVQALRAMGVSVQTGEFGADMQVELENDGPVTVIVEVA